MKLSFYSQGRDNNFNFIRIIAALAVLVSHGFALATGNVETEPFKKGLDLSIGEMAVDVFFVTSGFLVTSSLLNRKSTIEFVLARALRIFPALWVMLFLTVFVLGVFFTSLPVASYFLDCRTYTYLAKCSTLFLGVALKLPGVFENNPYKNIVNGSLWTLPFEIGMYAILAFGWVALRITKEERLKVFKLAIVTYVAMSGVYILVFRLNQFDIWPFINFSFMFFTGAAFYVFKEHIFLSRSFFCFFVIALLSTIICKHGFFLIFFFSIAYILFFLAYVPSGYIRKYNLLGDYSYGVYIYAFPVQQTVAALNPRGVSVVYMILISAVPTILLSIFSWHLLERPALGLKGHCVDNLRRLCKL